jgi:hypothetical protein
MAATDFINFDNVMLKLRTVKKIIAVTIDEDKRIKPGLSSREKSNHPIHGKIRQQTSSCEIQALQPFSTIMVYRTYETVFIPPDIAELSWLVRMRADQL